MRNPRSPAQTRALIAYLEGKTDATAADIAQLLIDVASLQDQADPVSAVFDSTMGVGTPIRILSSGNVDAAQADSVANARVGGIVFEGANATETGQFVPEGGRVTLADWSPITGSSALTLDAEYFLSTTAGMLTTTAPTSAGEVFLKVGRAISAQTFVVELGELVLL